MVHLYGIESPGLTSSLAIAEHVMSEIAEKGGAQPPSPTFG
jgi:L-2-hydroxyglutarate oxidase LhgO